MKEGEIVLADLLNSDGKFKKRPALILKVLPKYGDLLVCGVSTQIHQLLPDFDLLLSTQSNDFQTSGLIKESIIKLGFISVLPTQFIEGTLGNISKESHKLLIKRLCDYLMK
ncbi:MAG: type II toxin-antitoxin system PemK/MazF family toxin [Candidatus Kapabacteria bacterium]|nr:type II toxin-antitoxin system PemK/MazF family toxin [Candidatus Kapabacteria bacterium]